jgi:uncharacterized membrane protein YecN with MAPEG domain
MPLPFTLLTASALALVCLVLALRVGQGRFRHRVPLGDGGNPDMLVRMRSHANFVEYVPLLLILMGLLEMAGAARGFLIAFGAALVVFRILHPIGMPRPAPNPYRATGAAGTALLLLVAAGYGLVLAWRAL